LAGMRSELRNGFGLRNSSSTIRIRSTSKRRRGK
jgi:hypothetical protein